METLATNNNLMMHNKYMVKTVLFSTLMSAFVLIFLNKQDILAE